jgi:hypothetical protein
MDTLEIVGFLAQHPEFRPAALSDLVSQYARAWDYLRHDFKDDKHLLSLFDFGRGNFAYISIAREWQQTTGFLGKVQIANAGLAPVLEREQLTAIPARPSLANVARFQFFREKSDRVAGVWIVRQGEALRFALPITTGTRPGVADYLPAPHGLPGFAVPVEQNVPALVPYLELADGRTIVAADGADEIHPSPDGRQLRAIWRRWAQIGTKSGQLVDPGLTSEVRWRIDGERPGLERVETLTAAAPMTIRRWRVIVPTSAAGAEEAGDGTMQLGAPGHPLVHVSVRTPWPSIRHYAFATGDSPLGRGARGAVPLHVIYEAPGVTLAPGQPVTWTLTLRPQS